MIGNVVDVVLEMERIVELLALALITVVQQLRPLAFVKLELYEGENWNRLYNHIQRARHHPNISFVP